MPRSRKAECLQWVESAHGSSKFTANKRGAFLGWIIGFAIELVANLFGAAAAKDEGVIVQQGYALGCFVGLALCGGVIWLLFVLLH